MLTERSIVNFLVWVGGLIAGPYLATSALAGNYIPLLVAAGIGAFLFIFGVWRDKMCLLPLLGTYWSGKFNFLPLHLGPAELGALSLIGYYVIAYAALQRKKMKTGPMFFFLPILVFASIVFYHDHNFALRSMGEGQEGARGALFILVACAAYLCGVSVNTPSPAFFARVPFYCFLAVLISSIPYTITTYFPGLAPFLFLFTDSINGTALGATGADDDIVRNGAQAAVGVSLMSYLLAYYPINTWWRPHRWWVAALALGCCATVVMGGFRSTMAGFGLMVFVGAWCYCSWRALLLVPPLVLGVFLLTAAQDSHLVKLPLSAQRSLAFLPGDWDPAVAESAISSNDFRAKIQAVYIKEDAGKSPLIGNGFAYNSDEFAKMNYLALTQDTPDGYYFTKIFVTGKMFHTGWISLYDSVGLIGFAAFLFFGLALIWTLGRMIFGLQAHRDSPLFPLKVWMFCSLVPSLIGYFTVFGDVRQAFPSFCYFGVIWTHLYRLEQNRYAIAPPPREVSFRPLEIDAPVPA